MPLVLVVIFILLVAIPGSNVLSNDLPPLSLSDVQQAYDELDVKISVIPLAATPGDSLTLYVVLTNNSSVSISPELAFQIPDSLSLEFGELPSGTSYNMQTSQVEWRPILPGPGATAELFVPLTANVADIRFPDQEIVAIVKQGNVERSFVAPFWIGVAPSASIYFDPPQAAVGQPVRFTGNVSGPGPITQLWSLGDGRVVDVNNPEVVYSVAGTYQVILQASNPLRSIATTGQISIVEQPIARFSLSDPSPAANEAVNFVDQSGGQLPIRYLWDFGDGSSSLETNPVHHYAFPGTYEVHLTIQNDIGSSEIFKSVTVGQAPTADIVIDEYIDAGQPIMGQAFFDDSVTVVRWDMADGHIYEGEQVTHVYWSAGDYLVTVTATNEFSDTVIQRWVHVNPGILYLYLPLISKGSSVDPLSENLPVIPESAVLSDPAVRVDPESLALLQPLELPEDLSPAEQLFAYINEARRINNLAPLYPVTELSAAAQLHTNDMASFGLSGHQGSDGSSPALRVQQSGYLGGYAGEATAWGMQFAIEPVQFWLSSPAHQAIILNPQATNVGLGFSENYAAPNVWYWTAEFGSMDLPRVLVSVPQAEELAPEPPPDPVIQLLGPPQNSEFALATDANLIFTWSWPEILQADQRFVVYLHASGRTFRIGSIQAPQSGNQYQFKIPVSNVPVSPGPQSWQVRLEIIDHEQVLIESPFWSIIFHESIESVEIPTTPSEDTLAIEPTVTPTPASRR